ncbi:MAG TPA: hypothetical protein VH300_14835 [Thermoleophilaceae bacterium]|nr:hypothetical protein [Thermoleophilaceae bacterium]
MRLFIALIAAAITASLLVIPAGALAKSRDRDHDGMPDKWERKHHLNVHANDARRDPDRDHVSNLSEFRHGTNPRKADTDNDGINDENELRDQTNPLKKDSDDDGVGDADEVAGTIVSFRNNALTIQLPGSGAGTISGTVNDQTRIECDDDANDAAAQTTTARMSRDGDGDDNSGPGSDSRGSDDGPNHDAGDDEAQCTSADLKQGARVHEAKLTKAADGSNVFTKIELVPAGS